MKSKYKAIKIDGIKIDEHRHIMQQHIGRKLSRYEVVHHIDGNKRNNDISNLEIKSLSDHSSEHVKEIVKSERFREETVKKIQKKHLERYRRNSLNKDQAQLIYDMSKTNKRQFLAEMFNVNRSTITRIINGNYWPYILRN